MTDYLINHDKFIDLFDDKTSNEYKIVEIKTIPLFEEKFGLYSKHILTSKTLWSSIPILLLKLVNFYSKIVLLYIYFL